jgi:hypothetical protein
MGCQAPAWQNMRLGATLCRLCRKMPTFGQGRYVCSEANGFEKFAN